MCQNVALYGNGLTLSQTTNFSLQNRKEFADDILKFDENGKKNILKGRKLCRKKKNCPFGGISPFPTGFSKPLRDFSTIFI